MTELKFTPEPWEIDDDEGPLRLFVYNETEGNVCTVSLFDQRDREAVLVGKEPESDPYSEQYSDWDRLMANALLIKQSPGMFKLIRDLVSACYSGAEKLSPAFLKRAEKLIQAVNKEQECPD